MIGRDNERYLGDGVYASFDGYHIWLRTPRPEGDRCIALEAAAFRALVEFEASFRRSMPGAA